ncbi:MAG: dephospho-CoA kinase [Rhodoluna sp.]
MYLVGLTGGIAAGKSTVSDVWASLGAYCIDADDLAREIVEPGQPAFNQIVDIFGEQVVSGGRLDRAKLAELIFSDLKSRHDLEAITHPAIQELSKRRIAQAPEGAIVVYSIPLLVESKSKLPFDKIVTVEAPIEKQVQRLVEFRGLTAEQAKARIASQATSAQRAQAADVILNSNQDIELLKLDARDLWQRLVIEASR